MSVELNVALVRRLYEQVWSEGHLEVVDEIFAAHHVRHDLRSPDTASGPEEQAQVAAMFRAALPDLVVEPDLMLCDGEMVTARWTAAGTHTGAWGTVQPTGKRVVFDGVTIFRFDGGRVVEMWVHRDDLALLQQVGDNEVLGRLS